ncbi:MAG: HPr family phosphocarrier protein [Clostridiales bacterium]|jgi:phosphotransferase system HPr-like phosphotransfer protein|nr:HPr family phosphocarrier protein [Clostridiales bacterium]
MKTVKISLSSVDNVKEFVGVVSRYSGDFDLGSSRYKVDAKSIMGIFSLDLSSPLTLEIHNDDEADDAKEKLKAFIL